MRLKSLHLKNFGPFRDCSIPFLEEEGVCLLLTGKNNEGKSSILSALKLLSSAIRVANNRKQAMVIDDEYVYRLLQQDTEDLQIRRMVHNYAAVRADIHGYFDGGVRISVHLDPAENVIYATFSGRLPADAHAFFGFIPPLGPLDEQERFIEKKSYLKACLSTSLAPRHLRNHLLQLLTEDECTLVRQIVSNSWSNIALQKPEHQYADGRIDCFYREGGILREMSWAGQGLQVWFQIITHLVRLMGTSFLVLDEPEINLHPEKQNDLLSIIKQYYRGTVLIATHSVEMMNNVNVSHILHVRKGNSHLKFKQTSDRVNLEMIRAAVGSNFNLIASQFEDCEIIVFTEDTSDFKRIENLAQGFGIKRTAFNVPLHGFSEYRKAMFYKEAYTLLIGKDVRYVVVLDRDYYPEQYLKRIQSELGAHGIDTVFTIGKEIENVFLYPAVIAAFIQPTERKAWQQVWDGLFHEHKYDAFGSFQTLHQAHLEPRIDAKSVTKEYGPKFDVMWQDVKLRHNAIPGKIGLKTLRDFYSAHYGKNLSDTALIEQVALNQDLVVRKWLNSVFGLPLSKKEK
ncbi:MAG: AAA family ATPase [Verrucomicrobiota bacterium]|jgi:energy-coupling factor transporter ATP-binding protein EcfA2